MALRLEEARVQVLVEMLGGFRVVVDEWSVAQEWPHRRAADLVVLLALAPGRRLLRDQVVDALWPGLGPEAGAANLHNAAHHARCTTGRDHVVVLRGGTVALFPTADVVTDVQRLGTAAASGATRYLRLRGGSLSW